MEQSDKTSASAMSDHNGDFDQAAKASEQAEAPSSKRLISGTFSSISDAELMLATLGSEAVDFEENQ